MMNSTNRAVDDRRSADVLLHMTRIDGGEDADIHGSRVFFSMREACLSAIEQRLTPEACCRLPPDDAALLAWVVEGDPRGIVLLYDRYAARVYRHAYHLLAERGAAEDVVQETFLNVWRRAHTYAPRRGTVREWLLASVHHRAIDLLIRTRAKAGMDVPLIAGSRRVASDDTWATVNAILERDRMLRALATLPPTQRQVIALCYDGGLSHTEIAGYLPVPLGTVKGRLRLALRKLRYVL